jgi:integrase/recombinase XerD
MTKSYVEPEEVSKIEQSASNLRDKIMVRVLFHLGCRISEALGIAVEDIDLTRGLVTIQHLKVRLNLSCPCCKAQLGRSHSYCPKCGAKVQDAVTLEKEHRRVRTLPIDPTTLTMLREYISRGGPVTKDGKQLIFGINRHRAWQIIRECADKAGLGDLVNPDTGRIHGVSPHKLRDAFAVYAVKKNDSGDGLRLLQEQLGHTSFNTTARYRKVAGEELKTWYEKLWENDDHNTTET